MTWRQRMKLFEPRPSGDCVPVEMLGSCCRAQRSRPATQEGSERRRAVTSRTASSEDLACPANLLRLHVGRFLHEILELIRPWLLPCGEASCRSSPRRVLELHGARRHSPGSHRGWSDGPWYRLIDRTRQPGGIPRPAGVDSRFPHRLRALEMLGRHQGIFVDRNATRQSQLKQIDVPPASATYEEWLEQTYTLGNPETVDDLPF